MKREINFFISTISIILLSGCGENACDSPNVHNQILLSEQLVVEDSLEGIKDRANFVSRLDNVRKIKDGSDRVICEADIITEATLGNFNELLRLLDKRQPKEELKEWLKDKDWIEHIRNYVGSQQAKAFPSEISNEKLLASTGVTYAVKEQGENEKVLVNYRYKDRENFWLYHISSYVKPHYQAFIKAENERKETERLAALEKENTEAKALGYKGKNHRQHVENAIKNAERFVNRQSRKAKTAYERLSSNTQSIKSRKLKLLKEEVILAKHKKSSESFETKLKTKVVLENNSVLSFKSLQIVKGTGRSPSVNLTGNVTNKSKHLFTYGRLNGIVWSDRAGEINLNGMFLWLGKQGLEPGQTQEFRISLYDDFMPSKGETDKPLFAKSNAFGAWAWLDSYEDGMNNTHSLKQVTNPRVLYRRVLGRVHSLREKLSRLEQKQPELKTAVENSKNLKIAAQNQLKEALDNKPKV